MENINLYDLDKYIIYSSLYTLADSSIQSIGIELIKLSAINILDYIYKYYISNIIKNKINKILIRNIYILKICLDMLKYCKLQNLQLLELLQLYIIIINILERKINEIKFYELYLYNYYSDEIKYLVNNIIEHIINISTNIEYIYNLYPDININYHKLLNTNFSFYYNIIIKYLNSCSDEFKNSIYNQLNNIFNNIYNEFENLIRLLDTKSKKQDNKKCKCIPLDLIYKNLSQKKEYNFAFTYIPTPTSISTTTSIITSTLNLYIELLKKYKLPLEFLDSLKVNYNCLENKNIIELFICNIAFIIDFILPNIKSNLLDKIIIKIESDLLFINKYFIQLLNKINICNFIYFNINNKPIIYNPEVSLFEMINCVSKSQDLPKHCLFMKKIYIIIKNKFLKCQDTTFIFDPISSDIFISINNINNNIDLIKID